MAERPTSRRDLAVEGSPFVTTVGLDQGVDAEPVRRSLTRRLLADSSVVAGGIIVAVFVLAAIFAPLLAKLEGQSPYTYHLDKLGADTAPAGLGGWPRASAW